MAEGYQGVRRSGDELKYEILQLTSNIIIGAKTALLSERKYNAELFAWGGMIETFDSFIGIYYQKDEEYYKLRKRIKTMVLRLNPIDVTLKNKLKIKRLYDLLFRLICVKLAVFKIFPPLPVSYAQGIGEITEELRLLQEGDSTDGSI